MNIKIANSILPYPAFFVMSGDNRKLAKVRRLHYGIWLLTDWTTGTQEEFSSRSTAIDFINANYVDYNSETRELV